MSQDRLLVYLEQGRRDEQRAFSDSTDAIPSVGRRSEVKMIAGRMYVASGAHRNDMHQSATDSRKGWSGFVEQTGSR